MHLVRVQIKMMCFPRHDCKFAVLVTLRRSPGIFQRDGIILIAV